MEQKKINKNSEINNNNLIKNIQQKNNNGIKNIQGKQNQKQENEKKPTQEKNENANIFRDLSQLVSSTMNKINKYTKNRTNLKIY